MTVGLWRPVQKWNVLIDEGDAHMGPLKKFAHVVVMQHLPHLPTDTEVSLFSQLKFLPDFRAFLLAPGYVDMLERQTSLG